MDNELPSEDFALPAFNLQEFIDTFKDEIGRNMINYLTEVHNKNTIKVIPVYQGGYLHTLCIVAKTSADSDYVEFVKIQLGEENVGNTA